MAYDIVFWQNGLSIHQAPLMRALSGGMGRKVLVVVPRGVSEQRRAQGWTAPDYGQADVVVAPSVGSVAQLHATATAAPANVFSGVAAYPFVANAFHAISASGTSRPVIYSEPWDPRGVRGVMRSLKQQLQRSSLSHVHTVLACGALARTQFSALGVPMRRIVPFGYFVEGEPAVDDQVEVRQELRIVFIGELSKRKDPDLLIKALSRLRSADWHLNIVGSGPREGDLRRMVDARGLSGQVNLVGTVENSVARDVLRESDLLVLPSRFDGWGAVVNEALAAGTPALVSSACGSADLIGDSSRGSVFNSGDVYALIAELERRVVRGPVRAPERLALSAWAARSISADVAAAYLWRSIMRNSDQTIGRAPWLVAP